MVKELEIQYFGLNFFGVLDTKRYFTLKKLDNFAHLLSSFTIQ